MAKTINKSKVTYNYETRQVLMLKEAYERDLGLFHKLLNDAPRTWTFTVLSTDGRKELIANIPPKR